MLAKVSAAPTELNLLLSVFPQGFISGFALIPPWALQECRPCRALCRIVCVYPGFHIGLCPHFTLGFAGVPPFQGSLSYWLCFPRVSYRALPSFHPGLCRSAALSGLIVGLVVCPQGFISGFALISPWAMQECRPFRAHCRIGCVSLGFHIGLCPHFTLGYAGVSPFQGSLSDWAFGVLCRGIVFVKCVWVCKWIVAFVFLFDCDCMVCGIGGGID